MTSQAIPVAPATVKTRSNKYFFSMSIILYLIMLIGFAHSFFFRSMLHRGPLPPIFIIHSILNVTWLTALVSQSWLAMKNRIVNHKRSGMYWFALSILVVASNTLIIYETAHKLLGVNGLRDIVGPVFGNSLGAVFFIFYVGLAYFLRHRPDIHKDCYSLPLLA